MLTLEIQGDESFDNSTQEFVYGESTFVSLEHSLASISKWESEWKKPFLGGQDEDKTSEEILSYVHCMCLDPSTPREVLLKLTEDHYAKINEYIAREMTATWFNEQPQKRANQRVITSELVYNWMITLKIPLECQFWHFNKLTTLIKVINLENQPKKKMSQAEVMARHRDLNARRRQEMAARQS